MKKEQWRLYRDGYLKKLQLDIELITAMPDPVFGEVVIDCSLLDDENRVKQWEMQLYELGIDDTTPVLYFFTFNIDIVDHLLKRAEIQKKHKKKFGRTKVQSYVES